MPNGSSASGRSAVQSVGLSPCPYRLFTSDHFHATAANPRQVTRVTARHFGIIPTARVHDAGQIDASGGQIMRSPDAYRMHRRMVFRPNKFCFGWLDIEYPRNLLNDSCHLLDT